MTDNNEQVARINAYQAIMVATISGVLGLSAGWLASNSDKSSANAPDLSALVSMNKELVQTEVELEAALSKICAPDQCVTRDRTCGQVKLELWCANSNENKTQHGCFTEKYSAIPGQKYYSEHGNDSASAEKLAAGRWVCEKI